MAFSIPVVVETSMLHGQSTPSIGNESVPIQLAQYSWFPGMTFPKLKYKYTVRQKKGTNFLLCACFFNA